jgi:hypothetical protein
MMFGLLRFYSYRSAIGGSTFYLRQNLLLRFHQFVDQAGRCYEARSLLLLAL